MDTGARRAGADYSKVVGIYLGIPRRDDAGFAGRATQSDACGVAR